MFIPHRENTSGGVANNLTRIAGARRPKVWLWNVEHAPYGQRSEILSGFLHYIVSQDFAGQSSCAN